MRTVSASELGTTSRQPFTGPKRKLQPGTPRPAGPLRPPRLSSGPHTHRRRGSSCTQVSWAYSWLPPCLHLTGCLPPGPSPLAFVLDSCSLPAVAGNPLKRDSDHTPACRFCGRRGTHLPAQGGPKPSAPGACTALPPGWLPGFPRGLSFLFLSLLSLLCSVYSCGGTVFEDFLGEHSICLQ